MWKQKLRSIPDEGVYSRELSTCKNTIRRIRQTIELLEQKHRTTTEVFMEEIRSGTLSIHPDLQDDYEAWKSSCESLKQWEELEKQYEALKATQTSPGTG